MDKTLSRWLGIADLVVAISVVVFALVYELDATLAGVAAAIPLINGVWLLAH